MDFPPASAPDLCPWACFPSRPEKGRVPQPLFPALGVQEQKTSLTSEEGET